jgi:hypothetical protein
MGTKPGDNEIDASATMNIIDRKDGPDISGHTPNTRRVRHTHLPRQKTAGIDTKPSTHPFGDNAR